MSDDIDNSAENDALSGLGQKASLPDPREDTTVPDVARLFSRATESDKHCGKAEVHQPHWWPNPDESAGQRKQFWCNGRKAHNGRPA